MEIIDCFNSNNEPTNQTVQRDQMKNHPCYFRVVHLWIENEGRFLVQKRGKNDDIIPYMWAFTTGLVNQGESPIQAMIREAKEELSLTLQEKALHLVKIIPTHQHPYKTFTYVYYLKTGPLNMVFNDEVLETSWWTVREIDQAIQDGMFWDYAKLLNDKTYLKELYEKRLR